MPTFDGPWRAALIGAALLTLTACDVPAPIAQAGGDRLAQSPDTLRSAVIDLPGGTVRIGVPRGNCIAPQSMQRSETGAVVLAGDCAAIVTQPGTAPANRALLSAMVSDAPLPGSGDADDRIASIEELLHGGLGDRLLGENGGSADLVETRLDGDTVYALVDTGSDVAFTGASPLMWRAISEERGRMIVLSARTLRQDTAGTQALLDQVRAFREATRRVNRRP